MKKYKIKPFVIGFDILDLIDIIKKYNVNEKTGIFLIKFYSGESI